MGGLKGWERAVPIKRPDSLRASTFTQKAFIPSYDKSYCRPNMTLMLTMEYRRIWFEERNAWQDEAYPKRQKAAQTKTPEIKRRTVPGKPKAENPPRKIPKKLQRAGSKTDTGRGSLANQEQNQSKDNSPAPGNSLSSDDNAAPQGEGHELVPQCPRCGTFHAQTSRCPANVLCKDKVFREKMMADSC